MKIALVAAQSMNGVIGFQGKLPWHKIRMRADMARFKTLTTGHAVIMGRKTHQSIARPLPDRINIVLTRNPDYKALGCRIARDLEEALRIARAEKPEEETIFVIGGENVYQQALNLADEIFLTVVNRVFEGDARFPLFPLDEWETVSEEDHEPDEKSWLPYTFFVLRRKGGRNG